MTQTQLERKTTACSIGQRWKVSCWLCAVWLWFPKMRKDSPFSSAYSFDFCSQDRPVNSFFLAALSLEGWHEVDVQDLWILPCCILLRCSAAHQPYLTVTGLDPCQVLWKCLYCKIPSCEIPEEMTQTLAVPSFLKTSAKNIYILMHILYLFGHFNIFYVNQNAKSHWLETFHLYELIP